MDQPSDFSQPEMEEHLVSATGKTILVNRPFMIILPSDAAKNTWDFYIMILLFFVAFMIPMRLAFYPTDTVVWQAINTFIDMSFGVDIVLTFFSAYLDTTKHIMVTDKRIIAKRYITSWFFIDVISIFPFDYILTLADINSFARIFRFGKIYKLIRMSRMVRMLKLFKDRHRISTNMDKVLKISAGFERIQYFLIIFVLFCHICSCFFVLCSQFDDNSNWV